jgi:hypothetical protein
MFTDLTKFLSDLLQSVRTVLRIGGVSVSHIEPQTDHLKMNFGAVALATLLYFVVCSAYYAFTHSSVTLFDSAIVAVVFVCTALFVIFLVSLAIALVDGTANSDKRGDLWTTLLVQIWIISLLGFGIDLFLAALLHASPTGLLLAAQFPTTGVAVPDGIDARQQLVAASFYTIVAVAIVAARSYFVLKQGLSGGFIFGVLVALVFNVIFFDVMIFEVPSLSPNWASAAK